MNVGRQLLEDLRTWFLSDNREWSQERQDGFTWWPDEFPQTVELVGEEEGPDGMQGSLLAMRTDVATLRELDDKAVLHMNLTARNIPSLAGPLYNPDRRTLQLASLLRVHEEIAGLALGLAGAVCLMQLSEVPLWALGFSLMGSGPPCSSPPGKPKRPDSDPFLSALTDVQREGHSRPRCTEQEFVALWHMHNELVGAYLATHGGLGFTWEQPWLTKTCLGQLQGNYWHPFYGTGLLLRQSFPVLAPSPAAGARLAMHLNAGEFTKPGLGYGLGSWTFHGYLLQFTAFVPNFFYRPELLPNLYLTAVLRAHNLREQGLPPFQ